MSDLRTVRKTLLICLAAGAAFPSFNALRLSANSLRVENVYRKDFLQEYLLGKAARDGTDPYRPLPELARRYLGDLPVSVFPHPTPHPPPMALVGLPFSCLSYPIAAASWLILELLMIVLSIGLMMRQLGIAGRPYFFALVVLGFVGTDAYLLELVLGQVQSFLLFLLVLAWIALREKKDRLGGVALGTVFAMKFFGWPLILFLLLNRKWTVVLSSAATVVGIYCLSALAVGPAAVVSYFRDVAPFIASIYRADPLNSSLATLGWRLFWGTESSALLSISAPPLLRWHFGAMALSLALPALFAMSAIVVARRLKSFDAGFALLLCVSTLVSPITWPHYFVLATMGVLFIWMRLDRQSYPRVHTYPAIFLTAALFLPSRLYVLWPIVQGGRRLAAPGVWEASFLPSLTTLAPTALLMSICLLLWRVELPRDR